MEEFDVRKYYLQILIAIVCGFGEAIYRIVKNAEPMSAVWSGLFVGIAVFVILFVITTLAGERERKTSQNLDDFIKKQEAVKRNEEARKVIEKQKSVTVSNTIPDVGVRTSVQKETASPKIERKAKGRSVVRIPKHYTVVDTETTGLDSQKDRLIEIAAIRVRGGKEVARFETLVKPGRKLSKKISELTGITDEELKDAPKPQECLPEFLDFLKDDIIVAHNANFDVNFIYDSLERCELPPLKNNFVDMLRIAKYVRPDLDNYKLSTLAEEYAVPQPTAHRALADCETTMAVLQKLGEDADRREVDLAQYQKKGYSSQSKVAGIVAEPGYEKPESPFYGKRCVFTGELDSMTRREAAQLVVNIGGICGDHLGKKTNYLVVGQDEYHVGEDAGVSAKRKAAEDLIQQGAELQILTEEVFLKMLVE